MQVIGNRAASASGVDALTGSATATSPPGEDEVDWNMGGTGFVPAGSTEAEGYYLPVTEPDWKEFGKEGSE